MSRRRQHLIEATEEDLNLVNVQEEGGTGETEIGDEFELELESDTSDDEVENDMVLDDENMTDEQLEDEQPEDEQPEDEQPDEKQPEDELDEMDFNLEDLIPSISNLKKIIHEAGVFSIINSDNGKRIVLPLEVTEKLQLTETAQIGYIQDYFVVGNQLGKEYTNYVLKSYGAKKVIYCAELVQEATNYHKLDFSQRTSITFSKVTYKTLNGNKVALIHVKSV
jgi:hypothetical protein